MKHFEYYAPTSLGDCLDILRARPGATPLAGGTDLLVQLKRGERAAPAVVSLRGLAALGEIAPDGALRLGAMVRLGAVAEDSLLRERYTALVTAAASVGSVQIRNVATVGGNLCNAAPSADLAPPLLCLGAQVTLASAGGERALPLDRFFQSPGVTALRPGELLTQITLPVRGPRQGSAYVRHTPRAAMDLAVASAAAGIAVDETGRVIGASLALGAVAPVPMRARRAEEAAVGQRPSASLWAEISRIASSEARPITDLRASAAFRTHLVRVLTERALTEAYRRACASDGGARHAQ